MNRCHELGRCTTDYRIHPMHSIIRTAPLDAAFLDNAVLDAVSLAATLFGCCVLDTVVLYVAALDVVNASCAGDFRCSLDVMNVGCCGFHVGYLGCYSFGLDVSIWYVRENGWTNNIANAKMDRRK